MPAVTSVHNEGRWIGSSWVSDEVGHGHRPSPDQGQGSLCSRTMGKVIPNTCWRATWPQHHSDTSHFTKICTFRSDLAHVVHVPAFALSPPKKLLRSSFNETNVNVVIWAAEVQCQVTAKTTHRISWHRSRERQVKTERRTLPECQLGLYMRLHTPWNMCSMCPISCWTALFYCSVINPEICPNCHIFHCSDIYSTAVFKLCIMCFKVIDNSQIKSSFLFWDIDTCQTPWIIQIIAQCIQSISSLPQRRASISFHYVEMPCLYYHLNSAQQQELSADILKGSTAPVCGFDISINTTSCFHTCMSSLL